MDREEAKQWAELFNAYAEGKTIERKQFTDHFEWVPVTDIDTTDFIYEYRIKPQSKIRRMTYQELADWLRDEPQEHREFRWTNGVRIWCFCDYNETAANTPCDKVLIRRNHGKWEEPLVEE